MNWLVQFTQHCCNQLNDASMTLTSLHDTCQHANDLYYQNATRLVKEKVYSSQKGARAFLDEVGSDLNANRVVVEDRRAHV